MQGSKLLGTWLPSTSVLHAILDKIRRKYNIPEVLPGNKQLAATGFSWILLNEKPCLKIQDPRSYFSH